MQGVLITHGEYIVSKKGMLGAVFRISLVFSFFHYSLERN